METNKKPVNVRHAIWGIVVLESVALVMGYNGTILTLAVAAIAGLAGWSAPQLKVLKN